MNGGGNNVQNMPTNDTPNNSGVIVNTPRAFPPWATVVFGVITSSLAVSGIIWADGRNSGDVLGRLDQLAIRAATSDGILIDVRSRIERNFADLADVKTAVATLTGRISFTEARVQEQMGNAVGIATLRAEVAASITRMELLDRVQRDTLNQIRQDLNEHIRRTLGSIQQRPNPVYCEHVPNTQEGVGNAFICILIPPLLHPPQIMEPPIPDLLTPSPLPAPVELENFLFAPPLPLDKANNLDLTRNEIDG